MLERIKKNTNIHMFPALPIASQHYTPFISRRRSIKRNDSKRSLTQAPLQSVEQQHLNIRKKIDQIKRFREVGFGTKNV